MQNQAKALAVNCNITTQPRAGVVLALAAICSGAYLAVFWPVAPKITSYLLLMGATFLQFIGL